MTVPVFRPCKSRPVNNNYGLDCGLLIRYTVNSMYKSKKQVEKKLAQSKYIFKQLCKFRNRIFVKGGIDEETGARPLLTYLSSFLAHTRSILQYVYREAHESGQLSVYERSVTRRPIFKFFKELRDHDIHEYTIGASITISAKAPIVSSPTNPNVQTTGRVTFFVEELSDLDTPKGQNTQVTITTTLSKRIEITDTFLKHLQAEGKNNLVDAAKRGEELYERQEFEGESDLFVLCETYLTELEDFVACGISKGFISE